MVTINNEKKFFFKEKLPGNQWKWMHNNPKSMGHRESSPGSEVHRIAEIRKISNKPF